MAVCAEVGVITDEDALCLGQRASLLFEEVAADDALCSEPSLVVSVLSKLHCDTSEAEVIEGTGRILECGEKVFSKDAFVCLVE